MPEAKLYPDIDPVSLGKHYTRHLMAMTEEALDSKADIATQLAFRDQHIKALEQEALDLRALERVVRNYLSTGAAQPGDLMLRSVLNSIETSRREYPLQAVTPNVEAPHD